MGRLRLKKIILSLEAFDSTASAFLGMIGSRTRRLSDLGSLEDFVTESTWLLSQKAAKGGEGGAEAFDSTASAFLGMVDV